MCQVVRVALWSPEQCFRLFELGVEAVNVVGVVDISGNPAALNAARDLHLKLRRRRRLRHLHLRRRRRFDRPDALRRCLPRVGGGRAK